MVDFYKIPFDAAQEAHNEKAYPGLTDKVLYAILPQPDKLNEQIADVRENESDGENEFDGENESDEENESE